MHVTAIIAAGGQGRRIGGERPKQLLHVGGRAILERSVAAFLEHPGVHEVIVALPSDLVDDPPEYLRSAGRAASSDDGKPLRIVAGGSRRQDSVANAFALTAASSDVIVIHDAARPFASADLIARTIAAAAESGAAVAAVQATDTVKNVRSSVAESGRSDGLYVRETLQRDAIYLAQTPQAFRRQVLGEALALNVDATDEAALAERAGHAVRIVEGEASNIKITTPNDLAMAEVIARGAKPARTGRAGVGYDLHRLVEGRPLILGGVTIPFDRGLAGHSDADAVCHAITDAVLGAAGRGDIGRHFPDTDPKWRGASSIELLRRAADIVREGGFEVGNVDVTVILERPKLREYVDAMRKAVGDAIGIDISRVSIKAKTNEGVDAIGRGEAIAAHAIALIRSGS